MNLDNNEIHLGNQGALDKALSAQVERLRDLASRATVAVRTEPTPGMKPATLDEIETALMGRIEASSNRTERRGVEKELRKYRKKR